MKIIILEDDIVLLNAIEEFLLEKGHELTACISCQSFRKQYKPSTFDIAIIDVWLPDGDGRQISRSIREANLDIGIVMITGDSKETSYSEGLESGADYYLQKPIDLKALEATVNTLYRRLGKGLVFEQAWVLDRSQRLLRLSDHMPIELSHQDLTVLLSIMEGYGQPVSRKDIVKSLGQDFLEYDQRRLDTQIKRLRSKVKKEWQLEIPIKTVHAFGYLFSETVKIN